MILRAGGCRVTISPLFGAMLALLLISDRTGIMPLSLLAVAIHECGHLIMMRLLGIRLKSVAFKPASVEIIRRTGVSSHKADALIAAAGILGNLAALAACFGMYALQSRREYLIFAAVNIALATFNIMPVRGLDGGDLLRIFLYKFTGSGEAERISGIISVFATALLCVLGAFLWGFVNNPTLLLCGVYLGALTLISRRAE